MHFLSYLICLTCATVVALASISCPEGFVALNNFCVLQAITCPTNFILLNGICHPFNAGSCPIGYLYINGQCCSLACISSCQAEPEKCSCCGLTSQIVNTASIAPSPINTQLGDPCSNQPVTPYPQPTVSPCLNQPVTPYPQQTVSPCPNQPIEPVTTSPIQMVTPCPIQPVEPCPPCPNETITTTLNTSEDTAIPSPTTSPFPMTTKISTTTIFPPTTTISSVTTNPLSTTISSPTTTPFSPAATTNPSPTSTSLPITTPSPTTTSSVVTTNLPPITLPPSTTTLATTTLPITTTSPATITSLPMTLPSPTVIPSTPLTPPSITSPTPTPSSPILSPPPTSSITNATPPPGELVKCPDGTVLLNNVCRLIYCEKGQILSNNRCIETICPEGTVWTGIQCAQKKPKEYYINFNNTINTQINRRESAIVIHNINTMIVNATIEVPPRQCNDPAEPCRETDTEMETETESANTSAISNKCCIVVTPRMCRHSTTQPGKWNCYSRRYKRCGDFCIAPMIYLKAAQIRESKNLVVIPPNSELEDCRNTRTCQESDAFYDCSGCAKENFASCSSYCYSYNPCSEVGGCQYYDQYKYCRHNQGGEGCRTMDGCLENWCINDDDY